MAINKLTEAQAARLSKLYSDGETEILREINRLLLKSKTPEYSLAWQKTILARVREIRSQLLAGGKQWAEEAIPASYLEGLKWADRDPLSGNELIAGFGKIHTEAAQILADNTYSRLVSVDTVIGRNVDDIFREVSLQNIKGAVLGYETSRKAAKRIKAGLEERGVTGFTDRSGRAWNLSRYSKMLAQESVNQSFRQGTINRFQEHGHDLVRISTHSGSCTRCIPWQGRTLSISGNDPDYPSLAEAQGAGLLHVGCLHVLSLAPEEKDRYIAGLAERAAAIRNA